MKSQFLLSFIVIIVASFCCAKPDSSYTTKYDDIDLDQILQSDRLLKNYINCVLDKGRCTPDGAELKKNLPDALENGCSKCSEKQRESGRRVLRFLIDNRRDYWDQVEAKYDPDGKYRKKYEADLKEQGIVL